MARRLRIACVFGLLFAVARPANAGELTRVNLFDAKGERTGSAIVDRGANRVDFFDTQSRRTGWGRVDATGRVESFGLDGVRQGDTMRPAIPPRSQRQRTPAR